MWIDISCTSGGGGSCSVAPHTIHIHKYLRHSYFANLALEEPKWPITAIRTALKPLTRADLAAFAAPESLWAGGYGTALLQVGAGGGGRDDA